MPEGEQFHPITALVKNESGVLSRLAGLFARRGFNIDSLAVGETKNPKYSRMSIVVKGDRDVLDQVVKQLNKQVDVISVKDLSDKKHVERELSLIKVHASSENRSDIIELADIFDASVADLGKEFVMIEATDSAEQVEALEDLLKEFGIEEMARTGRVVLERSKKKKEEE